MIKVAISALLVLDCRTELPDIPPREAEIY